MGQPALQAHWVQDAITQMSGREGYALSSKWECFPVRVGPVYLDKLKAASKNGGAPSTSPAVGDKGWQGSEQGRLPPNSPHPWLLGKDSLLPVIPPEDFHKERPRKSPSSASSLPFQARASGSPNFIGLNFLTHRKGVLIPILQGLEKRPWKGVRAIVILS